MLSALEVLPSALVGVEGLRLRRGLYTIKSEKTAKHLQFSGFSPQQDCRFVILCCAVSSAFFTDYVLFFFSFFSSLCFKLRNTAV